MDTSPTKGHHQALKSGVVKCFPTFRLPPTRALPLFYILQPLSPPAQDSCESEWTKTNPRPVSAVPQLMPGFLSTAAAVKPLFQRLQAPPPARLYLKLRKGVRPESQRAGLTLRAVGGQGGRSPLRPTLERGSHQGSELRLLGLHIRSLTAASAFRHLVRRPGPAGPDIRLAHGVLWAAPTHARNHARARARHRRRLPPLLPAPTRCPLELKRTEEGWTPRGGGPIHPRLSGPCHLQRSDIWPALDPSVTRSGLACGVILMLKILPLAFLVSTRFHCALNQTA